MKDGINRVLCRLPREGKLSKEKFEFGAWFVLYIVLTWLVQILGAQHKWLMVRHLEWKTIKGMRLRI